MHTGMIEIMREQVHAIYRALTGSDIDEGALPAAEEQPPTESTLDEIERRFVQLDAVARSLPSVAERVPPFSFTPLLDAMQSGDELIVEMALPGVDRADVDVRVEGDLLVVWGLRRGHRVANGRFFLHAEIPRGPFRRTIQLPFEAETAPAVDLDRGLLRVKVSKKASAGSAGMR